MPIATDHADLFHRELSEVLAKYKSADEQFAYLYGYLFELTE